MSLEQQAAQEAAAIVHRAWTYVRAGQGGLMGARFAAAEALDVASVVSVDCPPARELVRLGAELLEQLDAGAGDVDEAGLCVAFANDAVDLVLQRHGGDRVSSMGAPDITSEPAYQQAVAQVTGQMTAEGQQGINITGAVTSLQNTWTTMVDSGVSGADALTAATSYVLNSQTIGGAADLVTGLVSAAQGKGSPVGLANTFTGTMVGIMVLAGATSAGVGAAIVAGVEGVLSLMQSAGFFGTPGSGTQLCTCGNSTTNVNQILYLMQGGIPWGQTAPNIVAVENDPNWDPQHNAGAAPGSTNWRSFPVSGGSIWNTDAVWYGPWVINPQWTPPGETQFLQLAVCPCQRGTTAQINANVRLVDIVFPQFHHMQCEAAAGATLTNGLAGGPGVWGSPQAQVASALAGFEQAFFAALRLNWEYALNGLKPPASDAQVLVHTIYNWNRAHEPGAGFDIQPVNAIPWAPNGTTCDGSAPPWYAGILAKQAGDVVQPAGVMNGTHLHINTGPMLKFSVAGGAAGKAPAPATGTSAAPAVLGITALAAGGAWFALGRPSSWSMLKAAFKHLGSGRRSKEERRR